MRKFLLLFVLTCITFSVTPISAQTNDTGSVVSSAGADSSTTTTSTTTTTMMMMNASSSSSSASSLASSSSASASSSPQPSSPSTSPSAPQPPAGLSSTDSSSAPPSSPTSSTNSMMNSSSSASTAMLTNATDSASGAAMSPTSASVVAVPTSAMANQPMNDWRNVVPPPAPTYIPMIAAIISGFCLLVIVLLLFLVMALVYRYLGKKDAKMSGMKRPKKGGELYAAQDRAQSSQYLVSSMSITSFGSSASDVRLDSHMPPSQPTLVHYNRGFDVDHRPGGNNGNPYEEGGYKPIQIVAADVSPKKVSHV